MKIGINGRFLSARRVTGVERVANEIICRLVALGDTEAVVFADANVEMPFRAAFRASRLGSRAVERHLWEQLVLPGLVRAANVDLLYNPINTAPLALENQLVVIHDVAFLRGFGWHSGAFGSYYSWLIPRLVKRSRGIVTVSEFSRNALVEMLGAPSEKVRVIYNGVGSDFKPTDPAEVKRRLQLPARYLLFVGSLEPRKNLSRLLQAVVILRERGQLDDLKVVIVGCANRNFNDAGLGDVMASLGDKVVTLGYVDDRDLPAIYSGATVFVFPSLYEGFGLTVLEAMACGTPVVVSNSSSLPEVVGDAGLLVDPFEIDAMADSIARVVEEPKLAASLASAGLKQASRFSWDAAADETYAFMKELTT